MVPYGPWYIQIQMLCVYLDRPMGVLAGDPGPAVQSSQDTHVIKFMKLKPSETIIRNYI